MDSMQPQLNNEPKRDLDFVVMPQGGNQTGMIQDEGPLALPPDEENNGSTKRLWVILGIILGVIVLGIAGYFVYQQYFSANNEPSSNVNLPAVTNQDDKLDSDNDGFTDKEEARLGTDSSNSDTDYDGISDGDEVNIYSSDPLLADTDHDGYDDSAVACGYSDRTGVKAVPSEKQVWQDNIEKYGLHEPTVVTLKNKKCESTGTAVPTTSYHNITNGYTVDIPNDLATREGDDGQIIGIYIAGTTPTDTDLTSDVFSLTTAVMSQGQSLNDWITSQYQGNFVKSENKDISSTTAVVITGLTGDECSKDLVLYPKDDKIIILTWTCNENPVFSPIFDLMTASFKFD